MIGTLMFHECGNKPLQKDGELEEEGNIFPTYAQDLHEAYGGKRHKKSFMEVDANVCV